MLLNIDPILQNLTVDQFLWGYKDKFLETMDTLQALTLQKSIKKFGMLMNVGREYKSIA
jgi:hypothetical protein